MEGIVEVSDAAKHVFGDRYRPLRLLGHGTYGEVFLAEDTELDRRVAVKVLRPQFSEDEDSVSRFLREARFAARVSPHPNIVALFDLLREGDALALVLEFIEGTDLRSFMDGHRPSIPTVVAVMRGMLTGLGAAHSRGIIHRDVKPANVLLDESGAVKLTDFGIAKALADASSTKRDTLPGTAAYMSPEQILDQKVGVQADLYAAAVILYELLTGRRLYVGETAYDVALQHVRSNVPSPRIANPVVSQALEVVVLRGLAKQPEERFAGAEEMLAAITAAVDTPDASQQSSQLTRATQASSGKGRRRYEDALRAVGAYLDQEPNSGITVMEAAEGFLVRRHRTTNTSTIPTTAQLDYDVLERIRLQLRRERPRERRVRHPGLWAAFPQGHQDFFRALGHELDAVSARDVVIDEGQDGLSITYDRLAGDATIRYCAMLSTAQIERVVNAAFDRRRDPSAVAGLDASDEGAL